MDGIFDAIEVSSKGLSVQRARMNVVAKNIANAETTETPEGGAYRREQLVVENDNKRVSFQSHLKLARSNIARTHDRHLPAKGTNATIHRNKHEVDMEVVQDSPDNARLIYDPSHPNANEDGYVEYPNVEIVYEMVDMMEASRNYEANTVAISSAKKMAERALDI